MSEPPLKAAIIPVTAFQQNCTMLWCTTTMRGAFCDPGGDLALLKAAAAQHGVSIEKIIVTHGHLDHCGLAGELAAELGVKIEGPHRDDAFWIDQLGPGTMAMGVPSKTFMPDRWLVEGDRVSVGTLSLDVIHCPGHTPGHVVFHHAPSRLALVGDVLFQGSIGRTDFPRGNHADLIHAITTKLWPLGDDTAFVPGHGAMSNFGHERKTNPFVGDNVLREVPTR
jgi:glyoxylase-like metal-dependent hydrolase (beta-lactamase superfamily II)